MIKALFCDFYGTMVHEYGPISYEVIKGIYKSGKADTPEKVLMYWWKEFKRRLGSSYGKSYRKQYDLALDTFRDELIHFECSGTAEKFAHMMAEDWSSPVIYGDTKKFMKAVKLPIYIVTNSDNIFIDKAIEKCGLKADGIFTSEKALCYKPSKEIFIYALEKLKLKPEEVIHIGDSLDGDVKAPESIGIKAIWMNREGKECPKGVREAHNFDEALDMIKSIC